ncbi:MAG: putative toxin-antitoxin system toxin component, PIN family, partial [Flammeovirgaceae bacterium]
YIKPDYIKDFYSRVRINWEHIPIIQHITMCRDAKDDKFLEVAINGSASTLISGDNDLLTLNPYNELCIITPSEFLK